MARAGANQLPVNDPNKSGWAERPENKQYDVAEGEYLAPGQGPEQKKGNRTAKGLGAAALGIGALLSKFKTLLLVLLNFKWAFILLKVLA